MKLFLNKLDIWLGRLVAALMLPLLYLSFFALSAFMLFVIGIGIFEYEIGLSDVDRLEFLLISLMLLTTYRLFYRGRKLSWSFWRLLKRFCFVTAIVILIDFFIFGLFMSVVLFEKGVVQASVLYQYQDAQFFILGAILVLALYAAAPLPPLFKAKQAKNEALTDKPSKADNPDEAISGRGEGFTYKDANEQPEKQSNERVDPWLSEGVGKSSQFGKGV